ncbi:hypothetical protein AGR1B_Cc110161 [Agrobacterium fabacearum S56]|jgi:hypothetical protein|uniref:Uncharacterized protein n=1 Tax=Agrobacterium radiobacter TaxID=362 RepID=A0ABD5LUZ4_AGRRD|nr:hypothetical protein [Agrobacterium tumefaciens]NTE66622.1 hypothetical protein [Agrobacterium tumefaciens]CUW87518.1 hypothetical protein AGR1B_Cc110161 [Agrobacterium fabacearum S56]
MTRKTKRYPVGTMVVVDKLIYEVVRYNGDCVIFSRKGCEFVTAANWLAHMVTDAILPDPRPASSTG